MHNNNLPGQNRGFTLIELMVVVVIIGILAALGGGIVRLSILEGHINSSKPYLMRLAAAERAHFNRKGVYLASVNENTIKSTLGVDLKEAGDFCFVTKTSGFITAETPAPSFEIWAILRNASTTNTGGDTVTSDASDVCVTVTGKHDSTGWAQAEDAQGGVGRSVVYRFPEPVDGYRDISANQDNFHTAEHHDWKAGISTSNALFD